MLSSALLRRFSPLDTLTDNGLDQVARAAVERHLGAGETLFRQGDDDDRMLFLLAGSVALSAGADARPLLIQADGEGARVPLSRLKPRRFSARAVTDVRLAAIDEDWLDNLLTTDQTAAYVVTEIPGEDPEWMFRVMSNPAFRAIPTDHFAALFSRLTAVEAATGTLVIRQGDPGDVYFIVRRGQVHVWRAHDGGEPVRVATLGVGDGFGEEALLSGEPRNATVVAVQPSLLMRLAMADFHRLLTPTLARRMAADDALRLIGAGARFIDVRGESEFRQFSLPASLHLPLCQLRGRIGQLDPARAYVTVCQTGRRATAAAFVLSQLGFDVHALDGGLNALPGAG